MRGCESGFPGRTLVTGDMNDNAVWRRIMKAAENPLSKERPPGQSFEALKSALFRQPSRLGDPLFDPGALRQGAQSAPQLVGRRASQLGERFDA